MRLATAIGDKELVLHGSIWRVVALLELGDIQAVDQDMVAYAQQAQKLRQPLYLWVLTVWQAMRAELRGDFVGAELGPAGVGHRPAGARCRCAPVFHRAHFVIHAGKKSLQEMEIPTRELAAQYTSIPGWRSALAVLCASMGREAEARQEFEYFAINNFAAVPRQAYWLVTLTNLAQVCVFFQDIPRAEHLYQRLLPFAAQCVVVEPGLLCLGSVARFLGQLAMTSGAVGGRGSALHRCHAA